VNPHNAPAVKANAMHNADRMVKVIRNFKNISSSFFGGAVYCVADGRKNSSALYNIYNIVHARARDVKEKG
jgi:hypothetical protein